MSDSLQKLIRLSNRHKLPVIVHDAQSGDSAVLMNLDEYEVLAELREECDNCICENTPEDNENEEIDETDFDFLMQEEDAPAYTQVTSPLDTLNEVQDESDTKQGKFSGTFQGKENFPVWNEVASREQDATPPWADPNFALFQEEKMKMAHELHGDKVDRDWDKPVVEEFKYEPNQENSMFPAFHPEEDEDTGEEPIFFEEPV